MRIAGASGMMTKMRERIHRSHPLTAPKIAHDRRLAHPIARRESGSAGSSLGFDVRKIAVTTPDDPAERQASDAAASLAPISSPRRGVNDENRAQTDRIAASLAPGSAGQALPSAVRTPFERQFGHDFSQVRVHTDAPSASSARGLDAHAYSIGRHVMFDAGRYAPDTPDGRRLLAHELTHVAQADAAGTAVISRQKAGADPKKIVAGRTTAQFESDVDDLGRVLDDLIAASTVLAPYINKSKLRAIKGSISLVGSAQFSTKYHEEVGDVTPKMGDAKDPAIADVSGFTQKKAPHNIVLREQRSNFGDALHEAIHRISLPGFTTAIGEAANEGTTEYFTRKVLAEAGLSPPKNNYDRQTKSIERLIDLVGEKVVGNAFFNRKLSDLLNAMGTKGTLWGDWRKAMLKPDYDAADALIESEKKRRQPRPAAPAKPVAPAKPAGTP